MGATREAADDFCRGVAVAPRRDLRPAPLHPRPARVADRHGDAWRRAGVTPATALAADALATRALFELTARRDARLSGADRRQPRPAARARRDAGRAARGRRRAGAAGGPRAPPDPTSAHLGDRYAALLEEGGLADRAALLDDGDRAPAAPATPAACPRRRSSSLDVPLATAAERRVRRGAGGAGARRRWRRSRPATRARCALLPRAARGRASRRRDDAGRRRAGPRPALPVRGRGAPVRRRRRQRPVLLGARRSAARPSRSRGGSSTRRRAACRSTRWRSSCARPRATGARSSRRSSAPGCRPGSRAARGARTRPAARSSRCSPAPPTTCRRAASPSTCRSARCRAATATGRSAPEPPPLVRLERRGAGAGPAVAARLLRRDEPGDRAPRPIAPRRPIRIPAAPSGPTCARRGAGSRCSSTRPSRPRPGRPAAPRAGSGASTACATSWSCACASSSRTSPDSGKARAVDARPRGARRSARLRAAAGRRARGAAGAGALGRLARSPRARWRRARCGTRRACCELLAELRPMAAVGPVTLAEVRRVLLPRLAQLDREPPKHALRPRLRRDARRAARPHVPRRVRRRPRRARLPAAQPRGSAAARRAAPRARRAARRPRTTASPPSACCCASRSAPRPSAAGCRTRGSTSGRARARVPSFYALDVVRASTGAVPDHVRFERDTAIATGAWLAWPAPDDAGDGDRRRGARPGGARPAACGRRADAGQRRGALPAATLNARAGALAADALGALEAAVVAVRRPGRRQRRGAGALAGQRLTARPYSVSALQRFSACPYQFLLGAIYRFQPLEQPEAIVQLDPLTRGAIFHEIQRDVLRALRGRGAAAAPAATAAARRSAILDDVAHAVVRAPPRSPRAGDRARLGRRDRR